MWAVRKRGRGDPLTELNLPDVANIRDLRDEVSRRTGRTVALEPRNQAPSVCGACAVTEGAVYVFYDPRTSAMHQDHIIAHEFSHLLLGHHEFRTLTALAPALLTTLDPAVGQMMLGRTKYDQAEGRDTELLASLLQDRIIDRRLRGDEHSGDDVQDRVAHTLLRRRAPRR